jgi:four helix bundle protein
VSAGLKELRLWQEAVALAAEVVRAARVAARRDRPPLGERLVDAALAVPARVAEGYARRDPAEQRTSFRQARAALALLETLVAIARQAGMLEAAPAAALGARIATVGRILAGYLVYVDRQVGDAGPAADAGIVAEPGPRRSGSALAPAASPEPASQTKEIQDHI